MNEDRKQRPEPSPPIERGPGEDRAVSRRLARAAAAFFVVVLLSFVFLGSVVQTASLPAGIVFTEAGLFLVPAFLFARAMNLEPWGYLRMRRLPAPRIMLLVLLVAAANYLLAAGGMGLLDRVLPETWHIVDVEKVLAAVKGWRLAVVIFGVVVLAPICEEAAFRGFMQPAFVARFGPVFGIGLTAFLFSALHADPVGFLPRFELGILFGWLVRRTGSLWPSVTAHAVNNGAAAVIFLVTGSGEGAATAPSSGELQGLAGAMILGVVVLLPTLAAIARLIPAPASTLPALPRLDARRPVGLRAGSPEVLAIWGLVLVSLGFAALLVLSAAGAR